MLIDCFGCYGNRCYARGLVQQKQQQLTAKSTSTCSVTAATGSRTLQALQKVRNVTVLQSQTGWVYMWQVYCRKMLFCGLESGTENILSEECSRKRADIWDQMILSLSGPDH